MKGHELATLCVTVSGDWSVLTIIFLSLSAGSGWQRHFCLCNSKELDPQSDAQ
jgi:hypothetical protein